MRHTAHRLLRLIALLQARRQWSGAELAERMGVDRRSIRRDIERLRELGYPVQASAGVGGGYQLGSGAPVLPMLLDEEEATTLAIALRAASATVAGIDDTARGLLSKLDPLVPARRRQQAGEVHAATATLSDLPSTDARLLGRLALHCRQAARLAFEYRSAQDAVTQREVEAQHLVNYGRRWYLLAWDLGRQDWRTLRVDRMGAVRECSEPGMHRRTPAPPDVMVRQAVSQAPFALQAILRLAGSRAELEGRIPPWCGVLEADGAHHCLLRMGAESRGMMLAQILSLDRVPVALWTTPPGLRDELAQRLAGLGQVLAVAPVTA
ncbi:helix-turn-helix transcriptional regulator [Stenotrophomonas geniculata]|uniref:helix-turn-helix transcriptional regulator n=1 Tax=Stenotrophomonas TaxID=40323 RepID=UPI00062D2EEB|nr:WYL domain-containing protein [Stenotrophomonas maltophilia]MCO7464244.1 WYL domain-containing protein [Stenotrophomonas maltophilia]HEL2959903.1 WYL domain-containing protein [Stenotrophomonas maltophilia]HEL4233940.1 WYL domain-containing protein [Stenotrophomonas maltophilia]HEL7751443.1 WYL domain-containing protein [Stenotrophomonas maltophilia]